MEQQEQHNHDNGHKHAGTLWDKIWRNKDGKVVIMEWPNIPLIGWAAANFVSLVSPTRGLSKFTWWIGFVFLVVWALLEIVRGVNYFRRGLGVVVLIFSIMSAIHGGM